MNCQLISSRFARLSSADCDNSKLSSGSAGKLIAIEHSSALPFLFNSAVNGTLQSGHSLLTCKRRRNGG